MYQQARVAPDGARLASGGGCQNPHRQGGRLAEIQFAWNFGHSVTGNDGKFGKSAQRARRTVDTIARRQVRNAATQRGDSARQFAPQCDGKGEGAHFLHTTFAYFPVDRVHAGCGHPHQDFAGARYRDIGFLDNDALPSAKSRYLRD